MSATNFKTENNTYRKLIGNGLTYRIPRFQRDYSWSEDEWEDLWADILGILQEGGEPAHYMGYLVLQSQDDKSFDVIDGQQRLTTLTLVVLAAMKNLQRLVNDKTQAEQNQRRIDQIRQTYIGYLDPVTLVSRTKLTLNRNNDSYFQTYLVPLGHLPQRGFRASEHSLRKAFEWFEKRVRDYAKRQGGDEGMALASLVETMSDKLFFTVISVTDELNAFKVFETLNARGVRLSSTKRPNMPMRCGCWKTAGRPWSPAWAVRVFLTSCVCTGSAARLLCAKRNCSRPSAARSPRARWFLSCCVAWKRTWMPTWPSPTPKPQRGRQSCVAKPKSCACSVFGSLSR